MGEVRSIDVTDLVGRLQADPPPILLDVLPASVWEEKRLPRAVNACVYETSFLEQVEGVAPDPTALIIVHCSRESCAASRVAADRLVVAGYERVFRFPGGRAAWDSAGLPFEGTRASDPWRPAARPTIPDRTYRIDPEKSGIDWAGRNVASRHFGTMQLVEGAIEVRDGLPAAGSVEIDMRSMEVGDLEGDLARALVTHLESDDFFAVDRFPTARVDLTGAKAIPGAMAGAPSCFIQANLTLRDQTGPVTLQTVAAPHGEGLAIQSVLEVDRTRWGVNYGSGRRFDRLGMHVVNDLVTLQVRVIAV